MGRRTVEGAINVGQARCWVTSIGNITEVVQDLLVAACGYAVGSSVVVFTAGDRCAVQSAVYIDQTRLRIVTVIC